MALLAYPEGDAMRFGELGVGEVGVGPDDVVLADGHGVDLDLVGDALGVAGLEVEQEGARRPWGREESEGDKEKQRGWAQPPGGRGSGPPRGHRRRSGRSRARYSRLAWGEGKVMCWVDLGAQPVRARLVEVEGSSRLTSDCQSGVFFFLRGKTVSA